MNTAMRQFERDNWVTA